MAHHDREHLPITRAAELRDWLAEHHATSPGVWVVTYRKGTGQPAPSYDEMVRTALCFGWVDSVPGKVDDERTKLYLSPRKPDSAWAATNKRRVEELIASGEMTEAGLAVVRHAQASGAWNRIDGAQNAQVPADLEAAFADHPGSREHFAAFPMGVRKQILEWIAQARTAPTRQRRIVETASIAAQNIRANQWRPATKPE